MTLKGSDASRRQSSSSRSTLAAVLVVTAFVGGCTGRSAGLTFGLNAGQHDKFFPVDNASKHALGKAADDGPINCDSCHRGTDSFQQFACIGCHEHRQDLTDSIHAGKTGYRYDSPSCFQCHPKGNADIGGVDDATHTRLYFPIDNGSAHHAVQCSECHTNPADRTVLNCTTCHDHSHDAAPMQDAHGAMTGYAWDTASCRGCHPRGEAVGIYNHTAYPITAGTSHAGEACTACHTSTHDWTKLACITCHDHDQPTSDSQHAGVPSYTWDSGSCYLCHAQDQVPGVIQHTFFPIDPGTIHALGTVVDNAGAIPNETIACTSCHKNPTDNSQTTCLGCHAHFEEVLAPIHNGITGYQWSDTACLFCHPHGDHDGHLTEHPAFPIATGTVHAGIGCTQCHASLTDRTQLKCTSCHALGDMQPIHQALPGWTYDSAACYSCHQQSQKPGTFDHSPWFPLPGTVHAVGAPNSLVCTDCHVSRTDRTQLACTTCHLGSHDKTPTDAGHQGVPNYSWTPQSCYGCHPNGTAAGATFNHPYFPITSTDTHGQHGITCGDCHTTLGDNSKVECTACHLGSHDQQPMTTRHAGVPGFAWSTTQCLFCHPHSEPVGNIDHSQFFPIQAGSAHAGIACASCHTDPSNQHTVDCAGCHAADTNPTIAAAHNGVPGFSNTSTACLQCHPNSESVGTMDHTAYFPIGSGSKHASAAYNAKIASGQNQCSACHSSRTDRTQNLCQQCHNGVSPTPSSSHNRVNGFSNTTTGCKQCHADSQVDTLASHTAFSPTHHGAQCVDCHRTFRSDKPWGINFGQGVCTRCHSSSCTPSHQGSCGG